MATIRKFEDLDSWKLARELAKKIFEISSQGKFATDNDLLIMAENTSGKISNLISYLNKSVAKGTKFKVRTALKH